jgi:LysR family transcriptional regulator (chromosome initiation inhibitor)
MLDYKLVEALAMVVREAGFDRAARQLNLTQSAVSQRIKLLEEQTGQVLLVRTTPPRATAAGKRFIKHYLQVARLEEDLAGTLNPGGHQGFDTLAIGINSDSLATWFLPVVVAFLAEARLLLDLRVDDQDRTHQMLRDGEVMGCISALDQPMQGCRVARLGCMHYRLVAAPGFVARWLPRGADAATLQRVPTVIFNRQDALHLRLFEKRFGIAPTRLDAHYLPSSEKFVDFILDGLACGMLPDLQSAPFLASGALTELAPACPVAVDLHWHCWNLKSRLLERFSAALIAGARARLPESEDAF